MTSLAQVLSWPLNDLLTAATAYGTAGERAANTADSLRRSFDIDPTWYGQTRSAAEARVTAESTRLRRLERTLIDVASTLRAGHGRMSSVQDRLRGQVQAALAAGFAVDDDGAVAHPAPKRRHDADYLTDRIQGLLDEADSADVSLGMKLSLLSRQLDGSGELVPTPSGDYAMAGEAAKTLATLSPDDLARYWESLSQAQRDSLIAAAPEVIGNLNGVDFADRARANQISIRAALAKEVAQGRGGEDKAEQLRALLEPAPDPQDPSKLVPRTFLGFHDGDNVRYIEMVGELTADSSGLAILVPGTGAGLHSAESYRKRATSLSHASGSPVIIYSDGDFPQSIIDADLTPIAGTAFDPTAARTIAPRLVDFAASVDRQILADGLQTPTTVIGHSYGGSIVGTAEQLGLRSDRVVYASSAGIGAGEGPWHNRNPGVERYSMTAPGDPIHYAQQFGTSVHGGDPDTAPGVTRMDSGRYSDGTLITGKDGHAGYLDDEGSDGMANLAAVVAGDEPTHYVPRAPDVRPREDAGGLLGDLLEGALRLVMPIG